jgi:hypothetical protein
MVALCCACSAQGYGDEAAAFEDDDSTGVVREPVMGTATFTELAGCNLTSTEESNFNARLAEAVQIGRRVAHMPAMRDCLQKVMVSGSYRFPLAGCGVGQIWGPYCAPDTPGCNTGATTFGGAGDPYRPPNHTGVMDGASDAQFASVLVDRVFAHGRTPNKVLVKCNTSGGGGTVDPGDVIDPALAGEIERVVFRESQVRDFARPSGSTGLNRNIAALLWHEVLHGHGFDHDDDSNGAQPCDTRRHLDQVPHIYGECMAQIIDDLANTTSVCPTNCTGGFVPVLSRYVHNPDGSLQSTAGQGCGCNQDPSVHHSLIEVDQGVAGELAINNWQDLFRRQGSALQTFSPGVGWTTLIASGVTRIHAGGDRVYAIQNGQLMRQSARFSSTFENLGTAANQIVIDDFGTAYRLFFPQIHQRRLFKSSWETIGTGFNVMYAGGDRLYARMTNGNDIFRYDRASNSWSFAGSPGADFTVTSMGTLYGLTPDRALVVRNNGGASWSTVGGAAQAIRGGTRLFATNSNLQVWQLWPDPPDLAPEGTWTFGGGGLESSTLRFSARADVFVAKKSMGTWSTFAP